MESHEVCIYLHEKTILQQIATNFSAHTPHPQGTGMFVTMCIVDKAQRYI